MQQSAAKLIGCEFSDHMTLSDGEPMGPPACPTQMVGLLE